MSNKRALIIKDDRATVIFKGEYLQISLHSVEQIIGFKQISGCYFNQNMTLDIKTAIRISQKVPLVFINKHGTFTAQLIVGENL